jgi:Uncharacterised nucleotidyltransferase
MAAIIEADAVLGKIDEFFMKESPVHKTLRDLARRLPEHNIDYAVIGGMALNFHGYERVTVDIDLLLTQQGLERFAEKLAGLGYVPVYPGAKKHFKHAETGVQVEIITTGEYPGDGKPKEVAFPDPASVAEDVGGIKVIRLVSLIELKLASGLSAPHRIKDLADVQQLIERLNLPQDLDQQLKPSVRAEYNRLWEATDSARRSNIGPDKE